MRSWNASSPPIRRSRSQRPDAVAANAASPPGFYELETPGVPGEPPFRYLVQLPPEYDPYRRYPAVVTLHGSGTTASQQIDWWAGARTEAGCAPARRRVTAIS